jgi:hypothetical protein
MAWGPMPHLRPARASATADEVDAGARQDEGRPALGAVVGRRDLHRVCSSVCDQPAVTAALASLTDSVRVTAARHARDLSPLGAARLSRAQRLARPLPAAIHRDLHATNPFLGLARVRGAHGVHEAAKPVG